MNAYLNRISTATPPYDIHQKFIDYVPTMLSDSRHHKIFKRLADRCQIEHRYSYLQPASNIEELDGDGFYPRDAFPTTLTRMQVYEKHAFEFACEAIDKLLMDINPNEITHLLVTSCTGFYAPGLDLQIVEHYKMKPTVERSMIGFMGCYAAINTLKLARHIVHSNPEAKVLTLNIELCTLHLQQTQEMEKILSFLIFADGCAVGLVSAKPEGIKLQSFHCEILENTAEQITWRIGNQGFDMMLSGQVPVVLSHGLASLLPGILQGKRREEISLWAIHPGGRSILDAVQKALGIIGKPDAFLTRSLASLWKYVFCYVDVRFKGHVGGCSAG